MLKYAYGIQYEALSVAFAARVSDPTQWEKEQETERRRPADGWEENESKSLDSINGVDAVQIASNTLFKWAYEILKMHDINCLLQFRTDIHARCFAWTHTTHSHRIRELFPFAKAR